jgi:hypothetical protein
MDMESSCRARPGFCSRHHSMYKDKRPNQSDISRRSCSSRPNETDSQAQRCARLAGISGGNGGELSTEIFSRRDPACNGQRTRRAVRSPPPTVLVRGKHHRRWAVGLTAHGVRWPWTFPYCQESPVSRLAVHSQAYLPKRAQIQAVVRPCGALLSFVWFDDSRTRKRLVPERVLRLYGR